MTAVLAMFARDANVDLKLQLMVVPSVDLRWSIASEPARSQSLEMYPSITEFAAMPWGPSSRMHWFMDHWIGLDQGQSELTKAACRCTIAKEYDYSTSRRCCPRLESLAHIR
jgi:acetyl esterase/lipase